MEVQFGPNSIEAPNLLYKLQRKIKVFSTTNNLPNRGYNLVASSSKYGIIFVGCPDGSVSIYYMQQLIDKSCESPLYMPVKLIEKPTYISISCDQELLAVTGGSSLVVYKVSNFITQNPAPVVNLNLGVDPSSFVSSLQWNPCMPNVIAIACFDGTLLVVDVNTKDIKKLTPNQSKARCLCWSPKGKQLVVGNSNGSLCQYKPDLSLMKTIPAPNLFDGAPVEAVAIHWISTYQFAVVFKNAADNSRPAVTIVNTPKGGQPTCINYEDICYSMGSSRPWHFYLEGYAHWNLILAASSNSMELATLASADGNNWVQWCQPDEARPELPLTDKKIENFPVGLCVDTCYYLQVPWGENETLPHMPILYVISQSGLLTIFNIINLGKGAPPITVSQPQQITLPAAALTSIIPGASEPQPIPAVAQAAPTKSPIGWPQPAAQNTAPVANQFVASAQKPTPFSMPAQIAPNFGAAAQTMAPVASQFGVSAQKTAPFSVPAQNAPNFSATAQTTTPLSSQAKSTSFVAPPLSTTQSAFGSQAQNIASFGSSAQKMTAFSAQPPPPSYQESKPAVSGAIQVPPMQQTLPKSAPQQASIPANKEPSQSVQTNQTAEANAKQERDNMLKASNELKEMLHKEINEFEMELYKFKLSYTADKINLSGLEELAALTESLQSLNTEMLRKDCSLEELRTSIIQLKLELVRTCAIVAEARAHSEAKEYQWTQIDPLSTKRLASVKKLAYYVQTQLEQAHKSLDYKWNAMAAKDSQFNKPGQGMIRPILDDVYQPLVRQQEILSRQQAVLRTLRNTMNECDVSPMFRSTSLLRNTPFRNNKDPLSKLTKNILNMSIDPQNKENDNATAMQKLDALRERLANHKTVKIKPVNLELTEHLAAMRINYEKNAREKAALIEQEKENSLLNDKKIEAAPKRTPKESVSSEPDLLPKPVPIKEAVPKPKPVRVPSSHISSPVEVNLDRKEPVVTQEPYPFGPTAVTKPAPSGLVGVARTLFTDEPKHEPTKSVSITKTIKKPTPVLVTSKESITIPKPKDSSTQEFAFKSNAPLASDITPVVITPNITIPIPKDPSTKEFEFKSNEPPASDITPVSITQNITLPKPKNSSNKEFEFKPNAPTASDITPVSITSNITLPKPKDSSTKEFAFKSNAPPASDVTRSALKDLLQSKSQLSNTPKDGNVFMGLKICSPASFSATTPLSSASGPFNAPKPIFQMTDILNKVQDGQPVLGTQGPSKSVPPNSSETGEQEKAKIPTTSNSSNNEKPVTFGAKTTPSTSSMQNIDGITKLETKPVDKSKENVEKTFDELKLKENSAPKTFGFNAPESKITSAFAQSSITTEEKAEKSKEPEKIADNSKDKNLEISVFVASSSSSVTEEKVDTPKETSETNAATSLFAAANLSTEKKSPSVFESTPPTSQSTSIFGSKPASPTSTPSIFGSSPAISQVPAPISQPGSIFGNTSASPASSIFASAAASSPPVQSPVFGSVITTTSPSVFGSQPFGSQAATPSIFGSPTSTPSVFASSTTTQPSSPTTTQAAFGATTVSTPSVFGQTTQASTIFASAAAKPSIFGAATGASPASVFGAPASTTSSVFGSPTATTQPSVFSSPTPASMPSIFGTPAVTQSTVFGATVPTTQASVFGTIGATTTQSGGSLFGATENLFASASISTTSAPSQSTGSIFGGGSPGFGTASPTNVFGSKPAGFGQSNTNAASIFGGAASTTFQAKPANNFWGAKTTSSAFGAPAFGQQTTTQASSVFGGGSFSSPSSGAFGSPSAQPSAFGSPNNQSGGSVFGTPTQPQQQSPGFGGAAGFGSKAAFGQTSRFGSPSGFGQSAFGSTAFNKSPSSGFGSGATFGGGATFGSTSPGKVFGGAPAPSFAAPTQSNATFESLATQNTVSFENLAQQTQQPQAPPAFNTSPSFTGWRG